MNNDINVIEPKINQNKYSTLSWIILTFILLIVIIFLSALSYFYFQQYSNVQNILIDPVKTTETQHNLIMDRISKIIDLPQDEKPVFISITEKNEFQQQPFFDKAISGDVALVYKNAKIAILYRPVENKVINVSKIKIDTSDQPGSNTLTPSPTQ